MQNSHARFYLQFHNALKVISLNPLNSLWLICEHIITIKFIDLAFCRPIFDRFLPQIHALQPDSVPALSIPPTFPEKRRSEAEIHHGPRQFDRDDLNGKVL